MKSIFVLLTGILIVTISSCLPVVSKYPITKKGNSDTSKGIYMPVGPDSSNVANEKQADTNYYLEYTTSAEEETIITEDTSTFIKFNTRVHDFGRMRQGEIISFDFYFTNTGQRKLIITEAFSPCGCTVAEFTTGPVPPNGEGFVRVTFNSKGKEGQIMKRISLKIKSGDYFNEELVIKAEVMPQ